MLVDGIFTWDRNIKILIESSYSMLVNRIQNNLLQQYECCWYHILQNAHCKLMMRYVYLVSFPKPSPVTFLFQLHKSAFIKYLSYVQLWKNLRDRSQSSFPLSQSNRIQSLSNINLHLKSFTRFKSILNRRTPYFHP